MNIRVKVTKKLIENGEQCDPVLCPVARAIKKKLPKYKEITVGPKKVYITKNEIVKYRAKLPIEAAQFINHFDRGLEVEPIEFELEFNDI